jgi:hypothetical protein
LPFTSSTTSSTKVFLNFKPISFISSEYSLINHNSRAFCIVFQPVAKASGLAGTATKLTSNNSHLVIISLSCSSLDLGKNPIETAFRNQVLYNSLAILHTSVA